MCHHHLGRYGLLTICLLAFAVAPARAEGYLAPFAGVNFGGDAGCQTLSGCENQSRTFGVALGSSARLLGFEQEFAYAPHFFGDDPVQSTSVLTVMSSVLVGPRVGPVRPYGAIGIGLIKTRVTLTLSDLADSDTSLGWNVGGGLEIAGRHLGVRGDVRYLHAFHGVDLPFVPVTDLKLDFGRASAGLVLRF